MKALRYIFLLLFLSILFQNCSENDVNERIEASGILQKQGITTYQYGTHVLGGYALRSSTIDLDIYLGQNITVSGEKVSGYPVDGGPDYIEVDAIY